MKKLIDTHSHIDMEDFEGDFDKVMQNAENSGVEKIIVPSVDRSSFDKIIKLCDKYEQIYGAIGIHPSEAKNSKKEDFELIKKLSANKKIVAIGECGLDYYWDKSFKSEQKETFKKQIEIANESNLSLIVHDRESHQDVFETLTQNISNSTPVIMHCFSGSVEFAKECVKEGFYIGIGGVVTFKNAKKMHSVVEQTPIENILLETDAPYLTPIPYRGKRNEPSYVKFVAEEVSKIKNIPFEEVAEITTQNARKAFKLL